MGKRGSSGQRSARFRRNRIMAHVAIVLTTKSKPTAPPMPPTITTTGAAERGMSVPRVRGALSGGRLGGVCGDGGGTVVLEGVGAEEGHTVEVARPGVVTVALVATAAEGAEEGEKDIWIMVAVGVESSLEVRAPYT